MTVAVVPAAIFVQHCVVQMLVASVWAEIYALVADAMNKRIKKSYIISLCALIASFSLVLLLLTGLVPVGTYALPCIAGVLLAVIVIEAGYPWAISVYVVVSALSFLLVADKEAALYYTAFLGIYPVVKGVVEKLKSVVLQYSLKFLVFNICVVTAFFVSIYVLSVPKESFQVFGVYIPWVFLLLGNVFFHVYDLCLTRLISEYVFKWRKKIKK